MFSLHSSNMGKRVTVLSHLSVKRFQDQFDEVKATPYLPLLMALHVKLTRHICTQFRCLGSHNKRLVQASWNPLLAGSYLLTLALPEKGFPYADVYIQTRTVLHRCNALRCRDMVAEIAFPGILDKVLESNEQIWSEGKPPKDAILFL